MERIRPTTRLPWTAGKVIDALRDYYLSEIGGLASFREVELHAHHADDKYFRRADMLSVFCYGASDNTHWLKHRQYGPWDSYPLRRLPAGWRTGFEIKVSRQDLAVDLKQEHKHSPLASVCNEIFLVHPRGLWKQKPHPSPHCPGEFIDEFNLPHGMGRIEVFVDDRPRWQGSLRARIMKVPSYRLQPETPNWFLSKLLLNRNVKYTAIDPT